MPAIIRFLGYNPLPPGTTWAERLVSRRTAMGITQGILLIMSRRLFGLGCALIFSFQLAAQPRAWNSVKAVAPGTLVRVSGPRPGAIQGVLESVSDDSLVLNSGAGLETFSLTQIKRISVKEKGHRGRNVLVGLGVGAGIGLVLGAVGDANCGTGCTVPKHFGIEALPPLFGGVGALVGAVIPSGGWREIYKQ